MIDIVCFANNLNRSWDYWSYGLQCFPHGKVYQATTYMSEPTREAERGEVIPISSFDEVEIGDKQVVLIQGMYGDLIQGTTSLKDFVHPEHAIYVFGHDTKNIKPDQFKLKADHQVYIPTPSDAEMWSFQALGIVLWDREMKHG